MLPSAGLVRRLLALLILSVFASFVRAGQFDLDGGTATGGIAVGYTPPMSPAPKFKMDSGGWYSAAPNCPPSAPTVASCSGKHHWAWTWSGTGTAPTKVVLKIESNAAWNGQPGGNCADGFGTAPTYTHANPNDPNTPIVSGTVTGVRYLVKSVVNGKIDCDVEPSSMCPAYTGCGAASRVTFVSPTLTFSGVVDPVVDKRLLIGQKLTATVNGLPANSGASYAWSIGSSPFIAYSPTNASASTPTPWASTNAASTSCYFPKPVVMIPVSCVVTIGANSFTLTDCVGTVNPAFSTNVVLAPSTGTLRNNLFSPTTLQLWGAVYNGTTWGIWWEGTVNTPAPFNSPSKGTWSWVQLATGITIWKKLNDGTYLDANMNFTSGAPRLDKVYPYGDDHPADNVPHVDNDAPEVPFGSGVQQVHADMAFDLYMLYSAPGVSLPVPLKKIHWFWNAQATNGPSMWAYDSRDQDYEDIEEYPGHPTWTDNLSNYPNYHVRP